MSGFSHVCREPTVQFHLMGQVDFDQCVGLQNRLVFEAGSRNDRQIHVLLCQHQSVISIGRTGSRGHIRLSSQELAHQNLSLRWTNRGGGCIAHTPGQVAVYPIVPLAQCGWRVGDYMKRLNQALLATVRDLGFHGQSQPGHFGIWGRTGQLAACGVAVKYDVTCHGAFLNVNPPMDVMRLVDVARPQWGDSHRWTTMSCLVAEHARPVKMTTVRAALVQQLVRAFSCSRYHLHTGHPLL